MKKLELIFALALFAILASCNSHSKRIILYASNDIQMDASQKNITVTDGTTHTEKVLDFKGSDPVTLNIQSPSGKFTLEATEDGLYLANLKPDTLIGSMQHIGVDNGTVVISQDKKDKIIDSLEKLITGANVSAANKNYFIKPYSIAKLGTVINAKVFGPFTSIPSGFDASTVPEVYKFYLVKDQRETIERLKKLGELNQGK
jgi:hypothetical protein